MQNTGPGWHAVEVPVTGGSLAASIGGPRQGTGRANVLLIHGMTASQRWWQALVARLAPDVSWVAVDLRGRGLSIDLPGPSGLGRHADDLATVVDQLAGGPVTVVGHSMGAFVATAFAERHPANAAGLVLVDGGLALPSQPVEAFIDLGRAEPVLDCRVSDAAIADDVADLLLEPDAGTAIDRVRCPMELLRCERGIDNDASPLIPASAAALAAASNERLRVTTVPDLDHRAIALSPRGVDAVSCAIERMVARGAERAVSWRQ